MQISINDLKSLIDPTTLQRGKDYFRRGLVADLEEVEEAAWSALVEGTETYEVKVKLEDDKIVESLCDCPYDFGPICKLKILQTKTFARSCLNTLLRLLRTRFMMVGLIGDGRG